MWRVAVAAVALAVVGSAQAVDVEIKNSDQAAFKSVSADLVAAINYKALGPAEATGLVGIGLGAVGSYVRTDNAAAWKTLTGERVSSLELVGLSVSKGLPFDIDVGAFYTAVPSSDVKIYGAELRYAILPGSTVSPAVALRGAYSRVSGISSFALDSASADLSISKGLGPLTPYAGVGRVWGTSDPDASSGLQKVDVQKTRFFIGLRLGLGLIDLVPEYETIGNNDIYSLKLGFSI